MTLNNSDYSKNPIDDVNAPHRRREFEQFMIGSPFSSSTTHVEKYSQHLNLNVENLQYNRFYDSLFFHSVKKTTLQLLQ